jgi:hypothetical protein
MFGDFISKENSIFALSSLIPSGSVYSVGLGKKIEFRKRKTVEPVAVVVFVDGTENLAARSGGTMAALLYRSLKLTIIKFSTEFGITQVP